MSGDLQLSGAQRVCVSATPERLARRFLALLLAGAFFAAACATEDVSAPVAGPLARLPRPAWHGFAELAPDEVQVTTIGGVTRPARLLQGAPVTVDLDWQGAARLSLAAARLDDKGGAAGVTVTFARVGSDVAQKKICALHLDGTASSEWQACLLDLPAGAGAVRLSIGAALPVGARVVISEPLIEALEPADRLPPVVLIVVDTTRADVLGAASPAIVGTMLRTLAPRSVVFEAARSVSSWTRPAMATLFTGRSPGRHQVLGKFDGLHADVPTLAEQFRAAGWITNGWTTNPNVLPVWGLARGFDSFVDLDSARWDEQKADGSAVATAVDQTLGTGGAAGRFLYIHLMDPHGPYQPKPAALEIVARSGGAVPVLPEAAVARPGLSEKQRGQQALNWRHYIAEVIEADFVIGRLFGTLERQHLLDRALFVVTADHGEEFLDHGGMHHGKTLYEELLRIPLLIKLPNNRFGGTRYPAPVDLADLAPTMLAALDLPPLPGQDGVDLLHSIEAASKQRAETAALSSKKLADAPGREPDPSAAPRFARLKYQLLNQAALLDGRWKLVVDLARAKEELYDLAVDPHEANDLAAREPGQTRQLRKMLDDRLQDEEQGWHILACGGSSGAPMNLTLSGLPEGVLPLATSESTDRIETRLVGGMSRHDFTFDLPLIPVTQEKTKGIGLVEFLQPDQDEVILREAETGEALALETLTLSSPTGAFHYRLGASGEIETALTLDLAALRARARVPPGAAPECPLVVEGQLTHTDWPYLRIWWIGSWQASAAEIDPGLQKRLRGLGYVE